MSRVGSDRKMTDKPTICLIGPDEDYDTEQEDWREHVARKWRDNFDFEVPYECYECQTDEVKAVTSYEDIPDYDPAERVGRFTGDSLVIGDTEYVTHEAVVYNEIDMIDKADALLVGWGKKPSVKIPMIVNYAFMMRTAGLIVESFLTEFGYEPSSHIVATRHGEDTIRMFETCRRYWKFRKPIVIWYEPAGSSGPMDSFTLSPWLHYHTDLISISAAECFDYLADHFGISL